MNDMYPVQLSVDYPDRDLNRLTTALRIFTVIPIAVVLASIGGYRRGSRGRRRADHHDRRRRHRAAVPAAAADDRVPAEVPALVV